MDYTKRKKKYIDRKRILAYILSLSILTSCGVDNKQEKGENNDFITQLGSTKMNELDFFTRCGIEVRSTLSGINYAKSYTKNGVRNIVIYDNQELRSYLDLKYPTFDDVRNAIGNNSNISDEFKKLTLNYVDKMEHVNPNLDLCVFYQNVKDFGVYPIIKEELEVYGTGIVARFDAKNKAIRYLDDIGTETFEHELTHMMSELYMFIDDNTLVHKTISLGIPIIQGENSVLIKYSFAGVLEGCTEKVLIDNNLDEYRSGSYKNLVKHVCEYLDMIEMDANDVMESGIVNFIDTLYIHGVTNVNEKFEEMDEYFYGLLDKRSKKLKI